MTEIYDPLKEVNSGCYRNGKLIPAETEENSQIPTYPSATITIENLPDLTPEQQAVLQIVSSGSYRNS